MEAQQATALGKAWWAWTEGGWLVLKDRWQVRFCAALGAIQQVDFHQTEPDDLGILAVHTAHETFSCPAHEHDASRVRQWCRQASERCAAAPRWCDLRALLQEPADHGGRVWSCRGVLALSPHQTAYLLPLGGRRPPDLTQRLVEVELGEDVRQSLAAEPEVQPEADGWTYVKGTASFFFRWVGPLKDRRHAAGTVGTAVLTGFSTTEANGHRQPLPLRLLSGMAELLKG